jgi:hypothetical protein
MTHNSPVPHEIMVGIAGERLKQGHKVRKTPSGVWVRALRGEEYAGYTTENAHKGQLFTIKLKIYEKLDLDSGESL